MSTVFVAREKELLLLKEYVDTALCGNANCVFIGGEAGIGKTTLVTKASRICSDKEL
ncbi:MAG: ATP-binding protein [Thermoplasmata archaeon]